MKKGTKAQPRLRPKKITKNDVKRLGTEWTPGQIALFNGLNEAILGFNPQSIGTQLNQVTTLFINNRWYLVSNMRQVLSEAYIEHGLIQVMVDVPVDDAFRGGIEIKTKQLDPEEIEKLKATIERENDLGVMAQAQKWNRLYGGGGVITLTDQDSDEPLDIKAIGKGDRLGFRAVDMWELFWDKQNAEGFDMELQIERYEFYNYYARKVHKSRVMKLKGIEAPSFIRPRLRGWGVSVVEIVLTALNQYLKATNLTFEVLDEFKVDVFGIKNLVNTLLSNDGEQRVRQRVRLANENKNYNHALVMDSEDKWEQKQLSFTGLAEVMNEIRMQAACSIRMPITKLFGVSAAGFNSGEDDIENYNSMVEQIREKSKFPVVHIVELRCQQLFGFIPDDITIEFKPLRVLSAEQEEAVKNSKFARLIQTLQLGAITLEQFADGVNRDNLLGIQLDPEEMPDEVMPPTSEVAEGDEGANEEDKKGLAVPKAKPAMPKPERSSKLDAKESKS